MMKYIIFFLLLIPSTAYGTITINNADFEFNDFALNVTTPITVESFIHEPDGFTTRATASDDLRKYTFDNSTFFNVRWIEQTSSYANFTITDIRTDVRGNVTGSLLDLVEIDQVSVSWQFTTLNIVDIDNGVLVEYFFSIDAPTVSPSFNAIVLSLNSPTFNRLGGVFAVICPMNSTLTGLLTNGTFICTPMSDFFP